MNRSRIAAWLLLGLFGAGGVATAAEPNVDSYKLENGLSVLLRPLPGAQHTAVIVLFDVGADHDPEGQSGLAHLLEHLYVTSAAGSVPARTIQGLVAQYAPPLGWNAQTGDRYTIIAGVKPNAELDAEIAQAAARMGALKIEATEVEREKGRLIEEVENMFGGLPHIALMNLARERVRPTAGGGRRGGVPEHVRKLTLAQLQSYWKRYYKPRNATLVLAGGFETPAAKASVSKHFGPLPKGEPVPAPQARSAAKTGGVDTVEVDARLPGSGSAVAIGVHAPDPGGADYAPFLVVVGRVLDSILRKDGMMALRKMPAPIWFPVLDDPWALSLTQGLAEKADPADALKVVTTRLEEALAAKVGPEDVMRVRNHYGYLLGLLDVPDFQLAQNPYGVAFGLGRRHQLGIDSAKLRAALDAVTDEDIKRIASTIFGKDKRAAIVMKVR